MNSVDTIEIQNFRNHKHLHIKFKKGINVIWGENGSGKTAILEAIYTLSMGRSFRTRLHKETLKEGSDSLSIEGTFTNKKQQHKIVLNQLLNGQRKFLIDRYQHISVKELVGKNPIVILSPEEQVITKGYPADRRSYFDKILSIVSMEYLNTLLGYQRILKQRNAAIRTLKQGRTNKDTVLAWNEPLIRTGKKLWKNRIELMEVFIDEVKKAAKKYDATSVELLLHYHPEGKRENFKNRLENSLNSDLNKGWTTTGPHRDNYTFLLNSRPLREFGSQGEHKIALVLIKMAEISMINKIMGSNPVLMLDDLFAKLDFKRADKVLSLLSGRGQTIITTTDIVDFEKHGLDLKSPDNSTYYLERQCKR
ncbi:MAG: DNA replication/repair protein RecF [Fidelibacterota bacterium]